MKLDVKWVNPFLTATVEAMDVVVMAHPVRTGMHVKGKEERSFGDISGVLGFVGDLKGSIAVSFSKKGCLKLISKMIGEDVSWEDKFVDDGVREMANIIVGGAKTKLLETIDLSYQLSLPSVIRGHQHYVAYPSKMVVVVADFAIQTLNEQFSLEVCVSKDTSNKT